MSQWVQHNNGGEKFQLLGKDELEFTYEVSNARNIGYSLPKSEYVICDPPEVWEDVTSECFYEDDGAILAPSGKHGGHPIIGSLRQGEHLQVYRLVKKDGGFHVERKAERKKP